AAHLLAPRSQGLEQQGAVRLHLGAVVARGEAEAQRGVGPLADAAGAGREAVRGGEARQREVRHGAGQQEARSVTSRPVVRATHSVTSCAAPRTAGVTTGSPNVSRRTITSSSSRCCTSTRSCCFRSGSSTVALTSQRR